MSPVNAKFLQNHPQSFGVFSEIVVSQSSAGENEAFITGISESVFVGIGLIVGRVEAVIARIEKVIDIEISEDIEIESCL